jgi:hypothetical protein
LGRLTGACAKQTGGRQPNTHVEAIHVSGCCFRNRFGSLCLFFEIKSLIPYT